jgi:serine/threonine protein kinase/Tol biopolymer transport system component
VLMPRMKHEDYQKVITIFQSAIKLAPEEKTAFLKKECGEDLELRRKVEQLLDTKNRNILDEPTMTQSFEVLAKDETKGEPTKIIPENQNYIQFGNYKIIHKIDAGGMGEVYLARDQKLERKVALKILSPKFTNNQHYLKRFKQEARAASALNHPYILTIYEFGENAEGVHFIASEFVEGETLNKFCVNADIDLLKKLDIFIRIASALSAAHEAGIIHRDIKPDNVIVRPDGYVKVIDFGLVKLIEGFKNTDADSEVPTRPLVNTNPGMIMGTANYMSPEQAKGKDVDARTDIFSFGIVLYEMIAGYLPFKGDSAMDMIAAILHKEPKPLHDTEIPHEIKRIIDKTLKKDRNERYQTMKDVLLDLKEARRELDFQQKLERSSQPDGSEAKTYINAIITATETVNITDAESATETASQKNPQTLIGKRLSYLPFVFVILLTVVIGVSIWWFAFGRAKQNTMNDAFLKGSLKTQKITNWANAAGELSTTAAFSGDGRFVAYGSTESGTTGIWVKQTNTGDAIQITKDEFYNRYPVWSPNGEEVVYYSKRGDSAGLWRVSLMGGQQKLVTEKIDKEAKPRFWSKSGKIYFQEGNNLFTVDEESGEVVQITDFSSTEMPVRLIKVSPDESQIVFLTLENNNWKISVKLLDNSQAAQIIESKTQIDNIVWHPDGKRILFSRKTEEFYQIFTTDLTGNEPVQVSFADGDSFIQDISSDGERILFSTVTENADLWRMNLSEAKESLVASQIDAELWADVSPDNNSIVYQSIRNLRQGNNLLSGSIIMQSTGKDARPLQLAEKGFLPQWSADGKMVAFLRLVGQNFELWSVANTGDQLKRISTNDIEGLEYSISPYLRTQVKHLSWSPKDSILAFPAKREGISNIWLVSADGSNERKLSDNQDSNQYLYCPIWALDGNRISFESYTKKVNSAGKREYFIWSYDIEKNEQAKLLETEEETKLLGWTETEDELIVAVKKDSKEFTLTPPEISIRAISIKNGEQRDLTVLKNSYFYNIHLSPDRKLVAFTSRSSGNDDIWISSLKGNEPRKLTENNDPRLYYSNLSWTPDGKSIFFGKQTRFTLLSMLINPNNMEKKDEKSNE